MIEAPPLVRILAVMLAAILVLALELWLAMTIQDLRRR